MDSIKNSQRILVCQQNGSGEAKIAGIRQYGGDRFELVTHNINIPLPELNADLVLDFLQHPDLSTDLARIASDQEVPVVASGKKIRLAITPPT